MNTALEYSIRVVQEGGRRCIAYHPIPLMNPPPLFRKSQLRVHRSSLTNGTTSKESNDGSRVWGISDWDFPTPLAASECALPRGGVPIPTTGETLSTLPTLWVGCSLKSSLGGSLSSKCRLGHESTYYHQEWRQSWVVLSVSNVD
jgi:hypothetical protein